jgi:hypothetical protein
MEETEKPRYPKDIDVGRIVIEETPEEKEEVIKRDVPKRDEVKPKDKDTEVRYEVERRPNSLEKTDVIKVGRLDVTDYQKKTMGSEQLTERTTNMESLGKDLRVSHIKRKQVLDYIKTKTITQMLQNLRALNFFNMLQTSCPCFNIVQHKTIYDWYSAETRCFLVFSIHN